MRNVFAAEQSGWARRVHIGDGRFGGDGGGLIDRADLELKVKDRRRLGGDRHFLLRVRKASLAHGDRVITHGHGVEEERAILIGLRRLSPV